MRRVPALAAVLGTACVTALAACGEVAGPAAARDSAAVALELAWPAGARMANAVFGAAIDSVRVGVSRQNEQTVVDTTYAWPARDEGFRLALDLPLLQEVETLWVYVDLMEGRTTTYYASTEFVVRAGAVPPAPRLELQYFGPGWDAVSLSISPRPQAMATNDTLQLTTTAINQFQSIVTPPVAWSVSDTRLASVGTGGQLVTRTATGTFWVRAVTPTGIADSVPIGVIAR